MSVCGAVIVMSSAYMVSCTESGGRVMSEVEMLKSMGESTLPCGTPDLNWRFVDERCGPWMAASNVSNIIFYCMLEILNSCVNEYV